MLHTWAQSAIRDCVVVFIVAVVGVRIISPHCSGNNVDVAYCYRPSSTVCPSVCLSVTLASRAKTAELIDLPFGLWTRVG